MQCVKTTSHVILNRNAACDTLLWLKPFGVSKALAWELFDNLAGSSWCRWRVPCAFSRPGGSGAEPGRLHGAAGRAVPLYGGHPVPRRHGHLRLLPRPIRSLQLQVAIGYTHHFIWYHLLLLGRLYQLIRNDWIVWYLKTVFFWIITSKSFTEIIVYKVFQKKVYVYFACCVNASDSRGTVMLISDPESNRIETHRSF